MTSPFTIQDALLGPLQRLERERAIAVQRWRWVASAGIIGLLILSLATNILHLPVWLTFAALPCVLVLIWMAWRPIEALRVRIRSDVSRVAAEALGLAYVPIETDPIDLTTLSTLGLCPDHNQRSCVDGWHGVRAGREFSLSGLHLRQRSERTRKYVSVFDGQILRLRFTRPFASPILLASSSFSLSIAATRSAAVVELADSEWQQRYVLLSNSQIEARYLFDSRIFHHLTHLTQLLGGTRLRGLIEGHYLTLLIEGRALFEPASMLHTIDAEQQALRVIDQLVGMLAFLDHLDDSPPATLPSLRSEAS